MSDSTAPTIPFWPRSVRVLFPKYTTTLRLNPFGFGLTSIGLVTCTQSNGMQMHGYRRVSFSRKGVEGLQRVGHGGYSGFELTRSSVLSNGIIYLRQIYVI